jgi:hypothetical protein
MKPGDDPGFFRSPPPEGRSRESTIRLDAEGHFFHEGERVDHPRLAAAMHTWIARHPDDGRYILNNGYDWTYFTVDDAPYTVTAVRRAGEELRVTLSDGTEEPWDLRTTRIAPPDGPSAGALYARVKAAAFGGPFEARFTRHAQAGLAPLLVESAGAPAIVVDGKAVPIGA